VSLEGRAEGVVPDRATFANQRSGWSPRSAGPRVHCLCVPLILPRHQDLNFSLPLDATVERSYHQKYLNFDELHELR
jgi:hypothetical protein